MWLLEYPLIQFNVLIEYGDGLINQLTGNPGEYRRDKEIFFSPE